MSEHDVVIVGAGPAGSTLGYLLSSKGFDVLVIDKDEFPRAKLCGGALTWKTRRLLEELYRIPFDNFFPVEAISEDYSIFEKTKRKIFQSSPEPFYFVSRKNYDMSLVTLARKKSCQFLFAQRAVEVNILRSEVKTHSGGVFRGRFLVGADGINSVIRKKTLLVNDFLHSIGLGFQLDVPRSLVKSPYQAASAKLFMGYSRCGYGWIFPNKEHFLVGLWGVMRKNPHLKEIFRTFLSETTDLDPEYASKAEAHMGAGGNFIETPGAERVLLLGDAAGLADPLTGEGIYYAHKSAELAALAIQDFIDSDEKLDLPQLYASYLRPVHSELKKALRLRDWVYSGLRHVGYPVARNSRISSKLSEIIHGTKSYSRIPVIFRWP